MKAAEIPVTVRASVRRPAGELRWALQQVLTHWERSHTLSLSVDLPLELQTQVEAGLTLSGRISVQEEADGQLSLRIGATGRRYHSFPAFWGVLQVTSSDDASSAITLRGVYALPLTDITRVLGKSFLRRSAHSILRQLLENLTQEAARVVPDAAASGSHLGKIGQKTG